VIRRTWWKTVPSGCTKIHRKYGHHVSPLGTSATWCVQLTRNQIPGTIAGTRFSPIDRFAFLLAIGRSRGRARNLHVRVSSVIQPRGYRQKCQDADAFCVVWNTRSPCLPALNQLQRFWQMARLADEVLLGGVWTLTKRELSTGRTVTLALALAKARLPDFAWKIHFDSVREQESRTSPASPQVELLNRSRDGVLPISQLSSRNRREIL